MTNNDKCAENDKTCPLHDYDDVGESDDDKGDSHVGKKKTEDACTTSVMIKEDYGYGKDYYCGKESGEVIASD